MRFVVYCRSGEQGDAGALRQRGFGARGRFRAPAERRANVRIIGENGAPVSLAELQTLAEIENKSDDA